MPPKIEDYALLGDGETAALVSRGGSIDWLCFPRFDGGACFAALLGTPDNGRWLLAPAQKAHSRRRYRDGSLVLETTFENDAGEVTVIDFMPPRTRVPVVVRLVEGKRGAVPMKMDLAIRFDYGSIVPWVRRHDYGLRATAGPDTLHLHTGVDLQGQDFRTVAEFTVRAGERVPFVLNWCPTHLQQRETQDPVELLGKAEQIWSDWAARCTYRGKWREAVLRSLITIKALIYEPTGGIVAAATTSLPESIGSVRNWDYRFCWLRDATFSMYALLSNGYTEEASAWREWLINAVAGEPSKLQIMYGLAGERRLTELELDWLPGYEKSRPVRIGNAAHNQFQLDVYGEVMGTLDLARRKGLPPSDNAWRIALQMMKFLAQAWKEPDEGIWEVRGPRRHFTHSKVMAWYAVDRAVRAVEQFGRKGPVDRWRRLRSRIHREVCAHGYNKKLNAFVQYYGSREPDASLLMLPLVGFLPPDDARIKGTVDFVKKELLHHGFVARYRPRKSVDGLPPGEGVFLLCTFWLADALALLGQADEAGEIFERLVGLRNDVGLLSEEYDPRAKRFLGNFPQAFSHIGLVNTARTLTHTRGPAADRAHA